MTRIHILEYEEYENLEHEEYENLEHEEYENLEYEEYYWSSSLLYWADKFINLHRKSGTNCFKNIGPILKHKKSYFE